MNILEAIEAGLHDDTLLLIEQAIKARRAVIPVKTNQLVRVDNQVRPLYWRGIEGEVKGTKTSRGELCYIVEPLDTPENLNRLSRTKMLLRFSAGKPIYQRMLLPRNTFEPI